MGSKAILVSCSVTAPSMPLFVKEAATARDEKWRHDAFTLSGDSLSQGDYFHRLAMLNPFVCRIDV